MHLRDDFWAETSTETLHELLESRHVFDTPEPELFATTISAELIRRGETPRLFGIPRTRRGCQPTRQGGHHDHHRARRRLPGAWPSPLRPRRARADVPRVPGCRRAGSCTRRAARASAADVAGQAGPHAGRRRGCPHVLPAATGWLVSRELRWHLDTDWRLDDTAALSWRLVAEVETLRAAQPSSGRPGDGRKVSSDRPCGPNGAESQSRKSDPAEGLKTDLRAER